MPCGAPRQAGGAPANSGSSYFDRRGVRARALSRRPRSIVGTLAAELTQESRRDLRSGRRLSRGGCSGLAVGPRIARASLYRLDPFRCGDAAAATCSFQGGRLKRIAGGADSRSVDAAARTEVLNRYEDHVRRFEEVACRLRASGAQVSPIRESSPRFDETLTTRELEVVQFIADGLTNREIGQRLSISEETVKVHIRHLFGRLQARSRAHAVAIGLRRGMVD